MERNKHPLTYLPTYYLNVPLRILGAFFVYLKGKSTLAILENFGSLDLQKIDPQCQTGQKISLWYFGHFFLTNFI